jgi:prepilin-type N-terminal cleavage/methylation domain-containing protein
MIQSSKLRRTMPHTQKAFSLVEILIVMTILVVISTSLALSFGDSKQKVVFNDYEQQIVNMMQQARGLSLANILVAEDEETDYYQLSFARTGLTLTALGVGDDAGSDPTEEEINSLNFSEGYNFDLAFDIYYFPPFGDICFSSDCSDGESLQRFTFSLDESDFSTEYIFNIQGGYPEEL